MLAQRPAELPSSDRTMEVDCPSSVTDTEEGRAFLQTRLALFGFYVFVLAGGSWAAMAVASLISEANGGEPGPFSHTPFSLAGSLHLANALLGGALWIATRTGQRRGLALHALDVGVSLGLIMVWVATGIVIPNAMAGGFVALLALTTGLLARAIVVPSTATRTLCIGLVGGATLVGIALWRTSDHGAVPIGAICWTASAVTLATLASHTIFGLRREAQKARVLGQYTLESKISEGGMGVVWRARHALLRRPTAVKLLAPHRAGDQAIRRFEREVQLTARLTHPNTVAIYDYGRTRDGVFYYAMELLEGTDLEQLVAEHGPQPPGRVVHVLTQVCGALAEAHDLGLVHRDVKPANILLTPRKNEHEVAKIVDFGLVKSIEIDPKESAVVSAINTITGTPLYMSPEAIQAPDSVDARSDLYSLGAVAWFLLVGRPPFEGGSVVEVCARHLHEKPLRPSAALGQAVANDLEDIVLSCLEKRRELRPVDARALRSKLEACSAAGQWTAERAADWWLTRAPNSAPSTHPSTTPQAIALDLARPPVTLDVRPTGRAKRQGLR
ncbi:MAG TPA: serine/threonine-protein kinase [Polyangiaceae bacterium]|nr:serine/threonine-protein kinase [Polyangiaceae bacterium]